MKYQTTGTLTNPVNDIAAANAYLQHDDMTKYLGFWPDEKDLAEKVVHIGWALTSEDAWKVTVIANAALTDDQSKRLSQWISGQNSDGLGEGFEQQDFAEVKDDWSFASDDDAYADDEDYAYASFDWADNDCKLIVMA